MKAEQEILSLLRSKKNSLEHLLKLTHQVIAQHSDDTEGLAEILEVYMDSREKMLAAVELFDRNLNSRIVDPKQPISKDSEFLQEATLLLEGMEKVIQLVFQADEMVFRKIKISQALIEKKIIENEKSKILLEKFKNNSK